MKTVVTEQPQQTNKVVIEAVIDRDLADINSNPDRWAFHLLSERLRYDLFHDEWEIRHGAAIGLREIIRYHAKSAGKIPKCATNEERNSRWLDDLCIRVLCLFCLDRFGDYVSDSVVAPIRETCAQLLGLLFQYLTNDSMRKVVQHLVYLTENTQWQVRHGGLSGMKYAVAIRMEDIGSLLPILLPCVISALDDAIDDVRSVAADTLVPIARHVLQLPDKITQIRDTLWNVLYDLDDLSSATASVMRLLAEFYTIAGEDQKSHAAFL
jgi:TATA-binding protein-associated factor